MLIKMLEAVSSMLTVKTTNSGNTVVKAPTSDSVMCAKLMLDKIIEGMREEDIDVKPVKVADASPEKSAEISQEEPQKIPEKREPAENEVEIGADGGHIKFIKNAKPDTKIIIDGGKPIPWKEAIGKPFQEITLA